MGSNNLRPGRIFTVRIIEFEESCSEGGIFKALLSFPENYPMQPPVMVFQTTMFHPNIYPDGKVCISILHAPGVDEFNTQEKAEERWRPILNVESVLVSVLSMLTDTEPNLDSPANVDAAKLFKENPKQYRRQKCSGWARNHSSSRPIAFT